MENRIVSSILSQNGSLSRKIVIMLSDYLQDLVFIFFHLGKSIEMLKAITGSENRLKVARKAVSRDLQADPA